MLNGLLKLALAALIGLGIVGYVTGGDLSQVTEAVDKASAQAIERKRERVAAANTKPTEPAKDETVAVVVKRSQAQSMSATFTMTGSTEADRRIDVRVETSGMVALSPRKGTRVRQGDLLCQLQVGDRAARRESAVARFRQAQTDAQAQQKLSDRGFAAANRASDARTSAEVIRAEIKQLDVEIARLEIRAPFDGVIEDGPAETGSFLQPGGVCATLVDPDPLRAVGFAPEFKVGELRLGMPGSAKLATGQTFQGTVVYIAQTADPATRTFRIDLAGPNPNYALRDAVTAEISIPLGSQDAHKLPQSALTLNDDGKIGLMVAKDGVARFSPVDILREDAEAVWVGGLGALADVIVVGQEYVRDGIPVTTTLQQGSILGEPS